MVLACQSYFSAFRREQRKVIQDIQNLQKGEAHPELDGWFFSDPFLFHHSCLVLTARGIDPSKTECEVSAFVAMGG